MSRAQSGSVTLEAWVKFMMDPSTLLGSPFPGTSTASIAKYTKEDLHGILKTGLEEGQASVPVSEVPQDRFGRVKLLSLFQKCLKTGLEGSSFCPCSKSASRASTIKLDSQTCLWKDTQSDCCNVCQLIHGKFRP